MSPLLFGVLSPGTLPRQFASRFRSPLRRSPSQRRRSSPRRRSRDRRHSRDSVPRRSRSRGRYQSPGRRTSPRSTRPWDSRWAGHHASAPSRPSSSAVPLRAPHGTPAGAAKPGASVSAAKPPGASVSAAKPPGALDSAAKPPGATVSAAALPGASLFRRPLRCCPSLPGGRRGKAAEDSSPLLRGATSVSSE